MALVLAVAVLVPARPATTVAGAIQPNGANRTALKNLLQQAENCGLNTAYSAMDKFGVDHCEDIKVSELPEGQSCEDFYSRQTLFTLCRGHVSSVTAVFSCARGSNFTCWVPGVSNLKDAKEAGIRRVDESGSGESGSGDCEDCEEVGPWLVPPGKMPYPNGPDGQPAVYPEGVCPGGCNAAGANPGGTNPGGISKAHLSVHKGDQSADGDWGFCWCPDPNDDVPAEVAETFASPSAPPPPPPCTHTFTSKASLKTAVTEFDSNAASAIATYGCIADWSVSAITDMGGLFKGMRNFNADISNWDTSKVTNMYLMFGVRSARALAPTALSRALPVHAACTAATQRPHASRAAPLLTSHARLSTRQSARAFNQPLSFDTSKVTTMEGMIYVRSARALAPQP